MSRSEILYLLLFIGVFPALWILAVVLDRFSERDELYTARREKSPSGRQSSQQTSTKQGKKNAQPLFRDLNRRRPIEPERRPPSLRQ